MKKLSFTLILFIISMNVFSSGTVSINGKNIKSKEELHVLLAKNLDFPKMYGKNMDSLYDVLLTDFSGESVIKVKNMNIFKARFGTEFTQSFLEVISDAAAENHRIILVLE